MLQVRYVNTEAQIEMLLHSPPGIKEALRWNNAAVTSGLLTVNHLQNSLSVTITTPVFDSL